MRCLVIEDYRPLRESIRECLREGGFVVDAFASGDEGLWGARNHTYDVIVLDIMLPAIDGLTILTTLRREHDATPVLLISARDTVQQRVDGLNAGADDYLIKPFDMEEMLARVKALARRRYEKNTPVVEVGDLRVDCVHTRATRGDTELSLTPLQYRLLEYLALREDQVVTRTEIVELVYQDNDMGDSNKVDVTISRLRKILAAAGPGGPAIQTRRGYGFLLSASAAP